MTGIQGKDPSSLPHIAAHLQGTENPMHKANLAKELQLLTHKEVISKYRKCRTSFLFIRFILVDNTLSLDGSQLLLKNITDKQSFRGTAYNRQTNFGILTKLKGVLTKSIHELLLNFASLKEI